MVVDAPAPASSVAGAFDATPAGVILHGSRSGLAHSPLAEFAATVGYATSGANGLGWNVTIGPGRYARHIGCRRWGYNAREWSDLYLAAEFSQARPADSIDDDQVDAFAAWFVGEARAAWPALPATFPTHAETVPGIRDGKTDAFPKGDPRADDLRARILAAIKSIEGG